MIFNKTKVDCLNIYFVHEQKILIAIRVWYILVGIISLQPTFRRLRQSNCHPLEIQNQELRQEIIQQISIHFVSYTIIGNN